MYAYLLWVGDVITILVALINEIDCPLRLPLTEQIHILTLVTGSDKSFQAKELEIIGKVCEEIADSRVITITKHCFSTEMLTVMAQFVVNVLQLRVELVFLCSFGRI